MELQDKTKRTTVLFVWLTLLNWLAVLIFASYACTHMAGASDTWKAIAAGRHYCSHRVDTVEPFSNNSLQPGPTQEHIEDWPKPARWIAKKVGIKSLQYWHPTGWINQNWLTGVAFYWLTYKSPFADADTWSFNSLVYCKFAVYILTAICVYYMGRLLGAHSSLAAAFACFAMFIGRTFFTIRPADFTNLLVAVFLLILLLTTYRNRLYIWLIVPLAILWSNLHGGYIYLFIMLVPFAALNLITNALPKRLLSLGPKGTAHTIAAGLVAFVAMILLNPFRLTNLTHIFAISIGKHANQWRSANEWHPAFEWKNPVGDEIPFLIMLIIAALVLLTWTISIILTCRSLSRPTQQEQNPSYAYRPPRLDLPFMTVALMTICMAVRSRRFIPIAAIASCPIIAMLIDQLIRALSARWNSHKRNRPDVHPMPRSLMLPLACAGTAAVLFLGTCWSLKFKRVYLDPWPMHPTLNSVFMRMTASDAKPFYACTFIRENNLKGNVFSYWTEGSFIALNQEPDPNTGRPPLQIFMDGRAQTAYDLKWQDRWMEIIAAGGPPACRAKENKRKLTKADYDKIGLWLNEQLTKYQVSVVLMPASRFHTPFVRALEHSTNWRLVFLNNNQKLFVDSNTPQGAELFSGIFTGKTLYPDDYHKNLIMAHHLLSPDRSADERKRGLEFAFEAYRANPSQAPIRQIVAAAKFEQFKPQIRDFCKSCFDDFSEKKGGWLKTHGYGDRIVAAAIAGNHLKRLAEEQNNEKDAKFYATRTNEYMNERKLLMKSKRW